MKDIEANNKEGRFLAEGGNVPSRTGIERSFDDDGNVLYL